MAQPPGVHVALATAQSLPAAERMSASATMIRRPWRTRRLVIVTVPSPGVASVSIPRVAERLGVTKGSFY